ncbi:MAG: hypothetical protein K2X28_08855 [Alphaproteobacteria bacterium]|nr:hypothetical protein [Alphaproteobacteria bacterium]
MNALTLDDLSDHTFDEFTNALVTRTPIRIADEDYSVCQEVSANPCFELGLEARLLSVSDLENLPDPLPSFFAINVIEEESGKYLTVSFTANNNPHWQNMFSNLVPMDKRYWSEFCLVASWPPLRYVNLLLQKTS